MVFNYFVDFGGIAFIQPHHEEEPMKIMDPISPSEFRFPIPMASEEEFHFQFKSGYNPLS
jgi:hypothetical protein